MAVRKGEDALRDEINRAITDLRPEIGDILAAYGVPRLDDLHQAREVVP
jgi:hypothetical protein